ncbi:hypothetical protein NW762_012898 [Fusarium torreyae]|uniref:JmjC domain-containing protein n=1 Tax=Fusarium torreyae TaxID=1237075 RepID=A0A9W8RNE2_9HYPO|nr:hypothetical protein NW762_012898 [Fusarium torreyae]
MSGTTHERNCPMKPSTEGTRPQYSAPDLVTPAPDTTNTLPSPSPSNTSSDSSRQSVSEVDDKSEDAHGGTDSSAPSTDRSSFPALLAYYHPQALKGLDDAKAEFTRLRNVSTDDIRAKVDSIQMAEILAKVTIGNIISVDHALTMGPEWSPEETFILCSLADARRLCDGNPPRIPVIVIGSPDGRRMTIEDFLKTLETRQTLDVHDFKDIPGEQGYIPHRLPSKDVIGSFKTRGNGKGAPMNMVNLGRVKDNAIPPCLQDRNDYKLIDLTRTDNGKAEEPSLDDFDDCVTFQLLATKGAAHLPHIDRHGVYTTALNEEGRKLWIMWPQLTFEELKSWRMGTIPDGGIAVYIGQGDMLIQPPNTLHSPVTLNDCLMTGTMHWHSSHLLDILRYTKAAVEDPGITNEAMARQFIPKMTRIIEQWKKDLAARTENHSDAYTWPPPEHLDECEEILEASYSYFNI